MMKCQCFYMNYNGEKNIFKISFQKFGVNKKLVQLETELKNGDIVEIETRKSAKPTKKWLDFAKTSLARRHIKTTLEGGDE